MGGGDDLLKVDTGSTIGGRSDGGNGFDTIDVLNDVTLGEVVNFEKLILEAGAVLDLASGIDIDQLLGAAISGDRIVNIVGHGFNIVYDDSDAANAYLGGRYYRLAGSGGGALIAAAALPEPMAMALLAPSFLVLAAIRRRGRKRAAGCQAQA